MLDLLGRLLEYTGLSRLGSKLVKPEDFGVKGGLHIAKIKRDNGNEGMVGVKYVDSAEGYQTVCDPEAHTGQVVEIEGIYTEETSEEIHSVDNVLPPPPESPVEEVKVKKPASAKKVAKKVVKK